MNLYFELLKKPVFSVSDLTKYYHNASTLSSALQKLQKDGLIKKNRKNLYTCVNGESGGPVADRFQIASAVTDTSFVSHHTAMEYYGTADQIFYEVYISSATRFRDFTFDGYNYHFVLSKYDDGIEKPAYSGGICISDRERTIIDSINDMERISGPEEVIANIASMKALNEKKLLKYLAKYNKQSLYQKTGFLLYHYQPVNSLSDNFFDACKKHIAKNRCYLTKDSISGRYDSMWNIVVADDAFTQKNGGLEINAEI